MTDYCIICYNNDGELEKYGHCGNFSVHLECLYKFYKLNGNRCLICKKVDYNSFDLYELFSPNYLDDINNGVFVGIFLVIFYSIILFLL